jgi:anti-sigma regulatory factor (Ser/Thr protein kinase)
MPNADRRMRIAGRFYNAPRPWMTPEFLNLRDPEFFHHGDFGITRLTPWMARLLTRHILADWQVPEDTIESAGLVTSELVTNAVLADAERTKRVIYVPYISLTLWLIKDLVIIEITDDSAEPPAMTATTDESEGGRGLLIVDALSLEWSHYHPRPGWKTVYCIL